MLTSLLTRASMRICVAGALWIASTTPGWARDEPLKRDRYMVVLREGAKESALSSDLSTAYGFRTLARFADGALVGIVGELDAAKVPSLRRLRAVDDAKVAAVRALADELASAHGVRVVSVYAPSSPSFASAMTERQALRMAADSRVRSVSESAYALVD